jgi:penicillin-binding protein 2
MSRLITLRVVLLLIVVIMAARLAQLQLVETDLQRFGTEIEVTTRRFITVPPRRGEILDRNGVLLAESMPIYNLAVIPGQLPDTSAVARRSETLARLAQIADLPVTLLVTPAAAERQPQELRDGLRLLRATAAPVDPDAALPVDTAAMTVPGSHAVAAMELAARFPAQLKLLNPIEELVSTSTVRSYQTVVIQEGISAELALAVRENANFLPGTVIVEGFQRRYPLSGSVPSLSHLLGYIGRVTPCDLTAVNPASSWLRAMVDLVSSAPTCGLIQKTIDPASIGLPPYQQDDRIGKDGLESAYESDMRGRIGIESLLVDALQRPVSQQSTLRPVENGNDLVLSIDAAFQTETERVLRRWITVGEERRLNAVETHKQNYDPIVSGVAVALDPNDGRVLAMASLPSYDNNIWVDPARSAELIELLAPSDEAVRERLAQLAPLTNRAVAGLYPPGSVIKQFVGAVALQQGVIEADTRLRDPGLLKLTERSGSEFILPNSVRNRDNGEITVAEALRLSSNVFFATIAGGNDQATNLEPRALRTTGLGIDRLVEGLNWFTLGKRTGIDLVGEAAGRVPTRSWKAQSLREVWTTGDTYNTAIGQGYMEVTPLQLAVAAGAVATDGELYEPHLVQQIRDEQGNLLRQTDPVLLGRVPIDARVLEEIRIGMLQSVNEGLNTSAREACSGLTIAGKTGTAEFGPLLITDTGNEVRQSHAWFVGFAPYNNPQIVVAVLVEGVGDLMDGSSTIAVPAATQIMQAYFGVQPPVMQPGFCPILPTGDPDVNPEPDPGVGTSDE